MCRWNRCLFFLMLLWLPVKGVLSAAMPFQALEIDVTAAQVEAPAVHHCHMAEMASDADDPLPAQQFPGHDHGSSCCGHSITCHGICAVFLATDFSLALSSTVVAAPLPEIVAFQSYISEFPDRPPVF